MMAASVPTVNVKDKKYLNWLKVNLALSYLKNGIDSFVESEVKIMHENLLKTIYGNKSVQKCTTCNSRDIRWTDRNWEFSHGCNLDCGKWLQELQKLFSSHINLDRILWTNILVQEWPFNPWECAKIFLPRGQAQSSTGPRESEFNALVILLASCEHFRKKLSPQSLSLTDDISEIRSSLMQTEAMEVSDADRNTYIQQIINFLQDPVFKSLEGCTTAIANVKKINSSSLEMDLEITALNAAINDIRLELGKEVRKTTDTTDCLKEEYKQLRELLIKELEDFEKEIKLHGTKLAAIQSNIQQQERKHTEMDSAVTSHEERLGVVEKDFEIIYKRSEELKTKTVIALQQQDQKYQDTDTAVKKLSESLQTMSLSIASCEERIVMCEDKVQSIETKVQNYEIEKKASKESGNGTSESLPCRRRESEDLKDLKNQTEDSLDTFRKMGFIPTTQTEEAQKLLQENRSIVIKGKTGEGKTSTALHLIDMKDYINQRVVIRSPKEWKKVDTDWVKIVVLEDIFGQYDLKPDLLQEWINDCLQTIQKHVDVGKLQVIITIRDDILLKASSKIKSFKLFSSDMSLTLSSYKLKHSDRMSILNRELERNKKDMNIDEKEECIFNNLVGGLIGFPQCCTLFAKFTDLFEQGPKFFESPEKGFVANITNLNLHDYSFLSLAFLFCSGEIEEEYLSPSKIKESKKYLPVLEELALYLNIPFNESTVTSLRQSYDHFSGLYVDKVYSYDSHYTRVKSCIQFSHATVYEAVGQVLGDCCPEMVVKYADSGYLYQKTYTAEVKDDTSPKVFIPVSVYGLLVKRMIDDVVEKHLVESVVNHSAFKQHRFVMTLKSELHRGNRTGDFLMPIKVYALMPSSFYSDHRELSEGVCMTFLQYILQRDEDIVRLVYREFLEFLECTHNDSSSDCWQCKEKQKLLELALYYHHFEIADRLIAMNACYTHVSLCNAARHGDLSRVQAVLEYLKRSQLFDPECTEVKKGLCRAYISGNQDVMEILLQEGITLDKKHVVNIVQHGDINALMKVVEHLKCHKKWNPHQEKYSKATWFFPLDVYSDLDKLSDGYDLAHVNQIPCSIALYITYCNGKFDMADYLVENEAKVSLDLLDYVSRCGSQQAVARVIQHLKVLGTFDLHCDNASEALEDAYKKGNYKMCNLLIEQGVLLTMKNLPGIVMGINSISLKPFKKAMKHLKDNNNWDPKCNYASEALEMAYSRHQFVVCDLLEQEGVSLTMKHLPHMTYRPLDYVKTTVKQLKDSDSWDPKCNDACEALEKAYREKKYEICDILVQEGVPLTMKHVNYVILRSLDDVKIAVKHLKDTDSWDPNCDDAFEALKMAYRQQKYDVYDLLIQEGVLLTLKSATDKFSVRKVIQQLKDIDSWDPKSDDASYALEKMYSQHEYDACDLLVHEGVSLTMKHLQHVIWRSLDDVKTAVKQLKETNSWDPKCDDASAAFSMAYRIQKHDTCDLLVQEGYSLTMKNLTCAIQTSKASLESIKKVIQQLKDANNWDPNCDDASDALGRAYGTQKYDVCDLLTQEGVSLTMKCLTSAISTRRASMDSVLTIILKLKATNSWDPKCDEALKALQEAQQVASETLWTQKLDVCFLLLQMISGEQ